MVYDLKKNNNSNNNIILFVFYVLNQVIFYKGFHLKRPFHIKPCLSHNSYKFL